MEIKIVNKTDSSWMDWEEQIAYEKEFVHSAILVLEQGKVLGQAIVYHNTYHEIKGDQCISVGNISLADDKTLFCKIHSASVEIAKSLHVKYIISPMDGSTWNSYRFVSYQRKAPFLLETTTEAYYLEHYKSLGYEPLASYYSQETTTLTSHWERCEPRYNQFIEAGMTFDQFDLSKPEKEFQSLVTFCNASFRKNFLFSPIQEEDFVNKMMKVIPILNPSYTILSRMNDDVTGFVFAYQDLHNQKDKSLVIKTLARDIDKPYGGLGSILTGIIMKAAIADGFTHCIHALMIDHNASTTISEKFHGEIMSRYELLYYTI